MKNLLFDLLMPIVPKQDLSHWVGRLVHQPLPAPLAQRSVEWFARYYKINMSEAELPITSYRTIGELFTRKLKPSVRPIGEGIVHPADAVISEAGTIEKLTLLQAKGKTYSVAELLRSSHFAPMFEGGSFMTYYLCPTDYHRVHSPVDGEIIWSCHIPGEFWPVNSWSVNKIDNLFAVNERVVTMIKTPRGIVAHVMVAATNVGNMTMAYDVGIDTRARGEQRKPREKTYEPPISIKRGEEVGVFNMGSTVVMLYEKGMLAAQDAERFRGRVTRMGVSMRPSNA
jgi:phosphatidylserine decarboxylase